MITVREITLRGSGNVEFYIPRGCLPPSQGTLKPVLVPSGQFRDDKIADFDGVAGFQVQHGPFSSLLRLPELLFLL